MINREDMLELTRRMTPARSHIDRIAGAYYDAEGYIDGTFNTHFLKLSTAEKTKNLELAKAVLQAETNKQLKDYRILETGRKPGSIWQLLDGIKESGLQNDAFLDLLYEMIGERVAPGKESYCFLFHGMYDVPVKGTDKEWQEGSEEVYNYLLCAVGPLEGEYTILPEATRSFDSYRMVVYSLVLVLMMIFRPGGLLGSYDFSMSRIVEKIMNGELFQKKAKEGKDHE